MRRTSRYVAMTRDERNAADAVPAQAGISVFQQPANSANSLCSPQARLQTMFVSDPSAMKHRRVFYYAYGKPPVLSFSSVLRSCFYEQALIPAALCLSIPWLIAESV